MRKSLLRFSVCVALIACSLSGFVYADSKTSASFEKAVDQYFNDYFESYPTEGTSAGLHQYDGKMEDFSKAAIQNRVKKLKAFKSELKKIRPKNLTQSENIDYRMLASHIDSELLELEKVRNWEKNPDFYSSAANEAAYALISRNFAPQEERLASLVQREKSMITLLKQAHKNLKNPPRIYTQIAIEQLPAMISFFKNDVPKAFSDVRDEETLKEFQATNQNVIQELQSYESFLKNQLLAKSKGDFRLGADLYRKKLLYDEMVHDPLPQLLKMGYEDLHRNQESFEKTAKQIDPDLSAKEVMHSLEKNHPKADELLASVQGVLKELRQYLVDQKIVTVPSPVFPIVEETPPFMRALTFASMFSSGPFETKAKESYYNVTLPEKDWPKEKIEEHLEAFYWQSIISTSIHEAYPGHYVQYLWLKDAPSKVRKLLVFHANEEGWAHYTEQMILDEGFRNGDLKQRLGQLHEALLRNARYIVAIEMHTGKMTYDQAIDFFVKEGYQTRTNAEREVKRGTMDPTYLVYTLGKLQIMKLRDEYKKWKGDAFTLQDFHDRFLQQGFTPVPLIREALLKETKPNTGTVRISGAKDNGNSG